MSNVGRHVIEGEAVFSRVYRPGGDFNNFAVTLSVIKEEAKKIKELGLNPRKGKEGDILFTVSRKKMNNFGEVNKPPIVVDAAKNPMTELIGRGSKVKVQINVYEYKKFGGGIAAELEAVQVVDLVPVERSEETSNGLHFNTEEGFLSSAKKDENSNSESKSSKSEDDFLDF